MSAKAKGAGAYEARRRRVGVGPRSTAAILIVKRAREMRRGKSRAAARAGGRVGRGRMRRWKGRGSAAGAREAPGQPEQLARGRWAQQGRITRFRSWFGWVFCTIWATVSQVESSSLWIICLIVCFREAEQTVMVMVMVIYSALVRSHQSVSRWLVMVMVMVIYTALVRSPVAHQSTSAGSFGLVRPRHG